MQRGQIYAGPPWRGREVVWPLDEDITYGLAYPLAQAITTGTPFPGAYVAATEDCITPQLFVRPGYEIPEYQEMLDAADGLDADDGIPEEFAPYG